MNRSDWHKSSYSDARGGNCVEVAEGPNGSLVRDTQNRERGHLTFSSDEWAAFVRDLKNDVL